MALHGESLLTPGSLTSGSQPGGGGSCWAMVMRVPTVYSVRGRGPMGIEQEGTRATKHPNMSKTVLYNEELSHSK